MVERFNKDVNRVLYVVSSVARVVEDLQEIVPELCCKVTNLNNNVLDSIVRAYSSEHSAYFAIKIVNPADSYKAVYVLPVSKRHIHNYYLTKPEEFMVVKYDGTYEQKIRVSLSSLKEAIKTLLGILS